MHGLMVRPLQESVKRAAHLSCSSCGASFIVSSSSPVMRRFVAAVQAAHRC